MYILYNCLSMDMWYGVIFLIDIIIIICGIYIYSLFLILFIGKIIFLNLLICLYLVEVCLFK